MIIEFFGMLLNFTLGKGHTWFTLILNAKNYDPTSVLLLLCLTTI